MAIAIEAPDLEGRLVELASRLGMTPEEYIRQLVETQAAGEENGGTPTGVHLYETVSLAEWLRAFDGWIDSHSRREPLPENAFDRASFYEA